MNGAIRDGNDGVGNAELVYVRDRSEVDAARVWTELVEAEEVIGYGEGRRGLGEEASSDRGLLDCKLFGIRTSFDGDGLVGLRFGTGHLG